MRVIYDLTFRGGVTVRQGGGTEEQQANLRTGDRHDNAIMDWQKVPECRLARVMTEITKRILGLRAMFGTRKQILLKRMDVARAIQEANRAISTKR